MARLETRLEALEAMDTDIVILNPRHCLEPGGGIDMTPAEVEAEVVRLIAKGERVIRIHDRPKFTD